MESAISHIARVNLELQPGPFTVSSYVERVRQIKWQNVMLMLSLLKEILAS
jgi:hypothetical protein